MGVMPLKRSQASRPPSSLTSIELALCIIRDSALRRVQLRFLGSCFLPTQKAVLSGNSNDSQRAHPGDQTGICESSNGTTASVRQTSKVRPHVAHWSHEGIRRVPVLTPSSCRWSVRAENDLVSRQAFGHRCLRCLSRSS